MSYTIVVARYNEPVDWLVHEFAHCIFFNKGKPLYSGTSENINEISLQNVGRESESYLQYIIMNYDSLPDVVVFTQARISDHLCMDDDSCVDYLINAKNEALRYGNSSPSVVHSESDTFRNHCWDREWNLSDSSLSGRYFREQVSFYNWFIENVNNVYPDPICIWRSAFFAVRKDRILARPLSYYISLLSEVSHDINPVEGHFFERSWYYIFNSFLN